MKKYERVTPIGIWTGKVMIGGFYIPKPSKMTENEYFIQGLLLGKGLPADRQLRDLWLQIKSIVRNTTECLKNTTR
jgi:hypothetical protein